MQIYHTWMVWILYQYGSGCCFAALHALITSRILSVCQQFSKHRSYMIVLSRTGLEYGSGISACNWNDSGRLLGDSTHN